jgi:hypothetical protein
VDHHWWQKLFRKQLQNDSGPEAVIPGASLPRSMYRNGDVPATIMEVDVLGGFQS